MSYTEVEFKYDAKEISIEKFKDLCEGLNPAKVHNQHGRDIFYIHPSQPKVFGRHRTGLEINQLTYKQKLSDWDSIVREEINMDLDESTTKKTVQKFMEAMGYYKGNVIDKVSFVYVYPEYVLAYYICYDYDMNELGRFIEIEVREDQPIGENETKVQVAWLSIVEKLLKPLGITPKNRISKSLFEMFGKVLDVDSKIAVK